MYRVFVRASHYDSLHAGGYVDLTVIAGRTRDPVLACISHTPRHLRHDRA
jgi:hypothetical protein